MAEILLAEGGELTLAHIYYDGRGPWRPSTPADAAERRRSLEILEHARAETDIPVHLRWRGSSSPGRGLHELAADLDADLLVIGSSPRAMLHRVLVGDNIRRALDGAPCAVAIAPSGFRDHAHALREIGVGYDGSPESGAALGVARELAARYGTRLSAFEAVDFQATLRHAHAGYGDVSAEQVVEEARRQLAALGLEAHSAYGHPAEELALYGASLDLLVIGSRGYGPLGRLVHGSTARELAGRARCALLVLTRRAGTVPAGAPAMQAPAATGRPAT